MGNSEFKSCCASLYQDKLLQFLVGPSLHPGGLLTTRRLAEYVALSSEDTVLDIASGLGESLRFLRAQYGCRVYGVDLSRKLATQAAQTSNGDTDFVNGDAEELPLRQDAFTLVYSECSMCLLPSFRDGFAEALRVLRPGGRLGVSDFTASGPLPVELENVLMSLLCIAQKMSTSQYANLVEEAGFTRVQTFDETGSLRVMLEGIRKRLLLVELLSGIHKLPVSSDEVARGKRLLALAQDAVEDGALSYFILTARKP